MHEAVHVPDEILDRRGKVEIAHARRAERNAAHVSTRVLVGGPRRAERRECAAEAVAAAEDARGGGAAGEALEHEADVALGVVGVGDALKLPHEACAHATRVRVTACHSV